MIYTFSEAEAEYAYRTWGANCGPTALAFALQMPLEAVRYHIPQFDERGYTSPSMMKAAVASLKRKIGVVTKPAQCDMFSNLPALVRIMWGGPWIVNGKPQRWAARQTHWICCYRLDTGADMVFDVNGGIRGFIDWERQIVPPLTASIPRCDGTWYVSNVWRITAVSTLTFRTRLIMLRTTREQRAAERRKARHLEHLNIVERRRARKNAQRKL